jgi:hypothetical protein
VASNEYEIYCVSCDARTSDDPDLDSSLGWYRADCIHAIETALLIKTLGQHVAVRGEIVDTLHWGMEEFVKKHAECEGGMVVFREWISKKDLVNYKPDAFRRPRPLLTYGIMKVTK